MILPTNPKPKVWLVGAGPGDPGLLTEKARQVLRTADIVFFDALVSKEILKDIPIGKQVYVGKRGGRPSPTQDEINRKLLGAASAGNRVVRLKGGDPFLFGRGGEEADALRKNGVRVGVIPGISSGMAAATYAGFPLTDRRYASSVTFLAAASAENGGSRPIRDYRALVQLGGTWVFFMGLKTLPVIVRQLIRAGANRDLPAAVISRGTTPFQRVVTASLENIFVESFRQRIESPALTIVGPVVSLRPPPLEEVPVLVMRPEHQAGKLSDLLRQQDADVTEFPVLRIEPIRPNRLLEKAVQGLESYDWILLTSGNSVRILKGVLTDPRRRAKLAAVGPGTQEALEVDGLQVDLVPPQEFRAEGLAVAFLKAVGVSKKRILIPQAEDARAVLAKSLKQAGHRVDVVPLYRTLTDRAYLGKIAAWVKGAATRGGGLVPLTSASMAKAFVLATRGGKNPSVDHLRLVSIGPITTATAIQAGLTIHAESPQSTLPDLVDTLKTVSLPP